MPLELMDSLYLPSFPLLSYLGSLKPYYCNKFYFETFDVLSVWLQLCYKSFEVLCVSALPIQGWHLCTEIWPFGVRSLHNGVVQPRNKLKMWNPRKMLLLHNTRETLAQLFNRRIWNLCTTYKAKMQRLLSQVCYICMVFRRYDPRWSIMAIWYVIWYDAMALA